MQDEEKQRKRAAILAELEPLFERAEREGLWFHCSYQDIWFSPAELRAAHGEGRFVWGPVNWTLRPPRETVARAEARAREAVDQLLTLQRRTGVSLDSDGEKKKQGTQAPAMAGTGSLLERAEREGLWVHDVSQDVWFSPAEFRVAYTEGRVGWAVWELRSPRGAVEHAEARAREAVDQLLALQRRAGFPLGTDRERHLVMLLNHQMYRNHPVSEGCSPCSEAVAVLDNAPMPVAMRDAEVPVQKREALIDVLRERATTIALQTASRLADGVDVSLFAASGLGRDLAKIHDQLTALGVEEPDGPAMVTGIEQRPHPGGSRG